MFEARQIYQDKQDELYLLVKYILGNKTQYVRITGMSKFLKILKRNGVMYTYEILPKVWKHDEYIFLLNYS